MAQSGGSDFVFDHILHEFTSRIELMWFCAASQYSGKITVAPSASVTLRFTATLCAGETRSKR
jgi:hypothetical protein